MARKSQATNFIQHQLKMRSLFAQDKRLTAFHISLYYALFFEWNENRFQNPFYIQRNEMMNASKIGSANTYTKCLKELHKFGYIEYLPSYNPNKGSTINLYTFDNGTDKGGDKGGVNVLIPFNKHNKQIQTLINFGAVGKKTSKDESHSSTSKNSKGELYSTVSASSEKTSMDELHSSFSSSTQIPPNPESVKSYFLQKQSTELEAEKFINHFQSNGWLVGGRTKMKNWHAAARNWILNAQKFSSTLRPPKGDNLHTNQNKDYSIPL
jgi:hypothetical protein